MQNSIGQGQPDDTDKCTLDLIVMKISLFSRLLGTH